MSNLKIESLQISNFRAFKGECKIDIAPDKPIVILYGNNGFGKTSFFDAIEWGLTGRLARYDTSAKERNEYEILRNQFKQENNSHDASVSINLGQGKSITRQVNTKGKGDYNQGLLKTCTPSSFIVKKEWADVVNFEEVFNLSHILTQELVSSFIRSQSDTERYLALVSLFGLRGYDIFTTQFKKIEVNAKEVKSQYDKQIEEKKDKISQTQFLLNHQSHISVTAMRSELASLIGNEIQENAEPNKILDSIQNKSSEVLNELTVVKSSLEEISYLEQNWQSGLERNLKIKNINESLDNISKLVKKCEILVDCHFILKTKDSYLEYCKDKNAVTRLENELKLFEESPQEKLSESSPLSGKDDITTILPFGSELGDNFSTIIIKLKSILEKQYIYESEIDKLEQILSAKLDLEKKLLRLAKEFFIDQPTEKHCPVCNNEVDRHKIINELENRLSCTSREFYRETEDKLTTIKQSYLKLLEDGKIVKKLAIQTFKQARIDAIERKDNLAKQLNQAKKQTKSGKEIDSYLNNLGTDINHIEDFLTKQKNNIEASPAFVENQYEESFYCKRHADLNHDLDQLQERNSVFNQLHNKYKLDSLEEVVRKKKKLNYKSDAVLQRKAHLEKAKEIVLILQKDKQNNLAKEKIEKLKQEKISLNKKIRNLQTIENDCGVLKQRVRGLIEEETRKLLCNYGGTIEEIYTYLNPHVYLEKLNFRIDDSNPKNNRLILEVLTQHTNTKMNPTYTFSSAQTNVLAISVFLGIALRQQWSNLNTLFLDDPIQNMDDINVHSFVDIIRSVVRETGKQFFISTHDERVFQFMKRKFRDTAQVFHFTGYGKLENRTTTFKPEAAGIE